MMQCCSIIERMEIQTQSILPLDLAIKYYTKWDCEIQSKSHAHIYYKYLTGQGNVQFLNGNSYRGTFHLGLMHGQGVYSWSNGLAYQGQFTNNNITGEGKLRWPDGSYYVGQVVGGKRDGLGEYYYASDKSNYKGSWREGLKQGKGTLIFANGSVYEGDFANGLRAGMGKMKYPSGNEYQGGWRADKKEGNGVMNWFSTFQRYEGIWRDDLPNGAGTYYWFDNKFDARAIKTIYKGYWLQGKREGYGAFYYNNGCKMQGTFSANLKEGMCLMMDEFGNTQIEHFKHDKPLSREMSLKESKRQLKLPQVNKSIIHNNQPTENIYRKIIDINSSQIDDSIYNLLLRENSQLRSHYKALMLNSGKQIFNGLNIESLWRLLKDMRISNEFITLAKLNRLFFRGWKSQFEIEMPNQPKLELLKQNPNILGLHAYQDLEWFVKFNEIKQMELDWNNWPKNVPSLNLNKVSLRKCLHVHDQDNIVLFRHFIVYILHLALLQHKQQSLNGGSHPFRKCLEDLLATVKTAALPILNAPSLTTQKVVTEAKTNLSFSQNKLAIPEEYAKINKALLDEINAGRGNLINMVDKTVTVRQIYCLLCQCGLLKEATQKMLFLQKIERNVNVKSSLLKKDNKSNYPAFEKIVLTSSYFSHIMNYEMIPTELDEILYKLLNRKIGNALSKEQFLKKYKETVKSMVNQIVKRRELTTQSKRMNFRFDRMSSKDRQREGLLKELEEERLKKAEEERRINELKREEKQRKCMRREDVDIKDDQESEHSEQYYD